MMTDDAVRYDVTEEEHARQGWYISNRDRFILAGLRYNWPFAPGRKPTVLDAACGTGGFVRLAESDGITVFGSDLSVSSIKFGLNKGRLRRVVVSDICLLPFADRSFDLIVASEVLEHVDSDNKA